MKIYGFVSLLIPALLCSGLVTPVRAADSEAAALLSQDMGHWQPTKGWALSDGVLGVSEKPGGYIWSKEAYENMEVSFDYKTSSKCNSGFFFRTDPRNPVQGGFEIQIASDGLYGGKHVAGSLYGAQVPAEAAGKPDGEWNTMTVTCNGPSIKVVLNGKQIIDVDIDNWDTAHKNPDGTKNKFKTALKDLPRTGHIGFQYHGHPVWYRNVKVRKL